MVQVIGVDVGGTKIEAVRVDGQGIIHARHHGLTEAHKSREDISLNLIVAVKAVWIEGVVGIGIGVPGVLKENKVVFMPNIPPFLGLCLKQVLSREFPVPIVIENDANCFALGEHRFGAAKGKRNVVGIVIGTGVGGGLVIDNKFYTGSGWGGELGHIIIDPSGIDCNCGNVGDFNSWCSGRDIVRHYLKAGGKIADPNPKKIFESDENIAQHIKKITIEKIAVGCASVANVIDPEIIVIGGGVSVVLPFDEINRQAHRYMKNKDILIVKSVLGETAGALGAAGLVLGNKL